MLPHFFDLSALNKKGYEQKRAITVQENVISIISHNNQDYISLTDMIRHMPNSHLIIGNWLRNKNTIEYLGLRF